MTLVNIFVKDDQVVPQPVFDARVSVYQDGELVTAIMTDLNGKAAFDIPDETYEVRVFKKGYGSVVSRIVVDIGATTNDFDLWVEDLTALPVAVDPRMCRCTGRFVNLEGRPVGGVTFKVMAIAETGMQIPKIVDGDLVFSDSMTFQTGTDGKLIIDLFRGGQYHVMFAGEDDTTWCLTVPDRGAANLIDLIFPEPVSLTWDQTDAPGNAVTVPMNETVSVRMSVMFSNFIERTELTPWIQLFTDDPLVIDLGFAGSTGKAYIRGIFPGNAVVTAGLKPNLRPFRVPEYMLVAQALNVTVTA